MAKLEVEVWKNEYELYDYALLVNGSPYTSEGNYTSEGRAIQAALTAGQEWWAVR